MNSYKSEINKTLEKKNISFAIILFSMIMYLSSYRVSNYNYQIVSILVLYIGIVISLGRKDVIVFLFLSSFMIFLVTRSFIDYIEGYRWFEGWEQQFISKATTVLYLSVFSLFIGMKTATRMTPSLSIPKTSEKRVNKYFSLGENKSLFIFLILTLYIISYLFHFYIELDKYLFMRGRLYEDFYLYYNPNFSIVIRFFSGVNIYLLLLLLSLKPNKFMTYLLFLFHIVATVPTLLIGQRGDFMLAAVLMVVYFLIRATTDTKIKWINKYNVTAVVIMVPIIILLMSYVNEGRHGGTFDFSGFFSTAKTFIHKQGVTFDAFMHGIQSEGEIRELTGSKNYVFGEIIDFLKYNPLSRILFKTTPLPSGNNVVKALNSGSYAHILSYVTHHSYLKGFGFGTSYVSELFHTYGTIGVILFNILVGGVLVKLRDMYEKNVYLRFISLIIISNILYIPRQSFASFIMFIVHPYFWSIVFIALGIALLLGKFKRNIVKIPVIEKLFD